MEKQRAKTRLIIAEDHAITQMGIELLVRSLPDYELIKICSDGQSLMQAAETVGADLVILDANLPDTDGVSLLAELVDRLGLTVIVLTGEQSSQRFALARSLGARAVVSKADPPDCIATALTACRKGDPYLSPTVQNALSGAEGPQVHCTPRQMAILYYLAVGETNKEIGYRLKIAPPTVSFHLNELRKKLGAPTNKKIVPLARQAGLI